MFSKQLSNYKTLWQSIQKVGEKVEKTMHEMKEGKLKSGSDAK